MRRSLILLVVAIVAAFAGSLAYRHYTAIEPVTTATQAPPLSINTLEGKTLTLQSLRGHWVLVNFWASWCAPCMDEIPHLVQAQADFGSLGLQIVGPALDDADAVTPVLKRFAINYPVSADFNTAQAAMTSLGNERGVLPFSVLVDPDGFIVERVLGGLSADALQQLLHQHLGH